MKKDWMACDGTGRESRSGASIAEEQPMGASLTPLSRRTLLTTAALGWIGWLGARRGALAELTLRPSKGKDDGRILVVLFLRGGLDGLNAVVPYAEDDYHRLRPTLGLKAPNDKTSSSIDRTLDLDGFFGLNPALAPLLPPFREGRLSVVHAVGSNDLTRSHFEAMSAMERGVATAKASASSGWLARYLNATAAEPLSPLRAVALSSTMPDSLRGATHAIQLESLDDFRLSSGDRKWVESFQKGLGELYEGGSDAVREAGRQTLEVLDSLSKIDLDSYPSERGVAYPDSELGRGLRQVAVMIKTGLGLEVACLDRGGWDTHFGQGRSEGLLTGLLDDLARSLAAFAADIRAFRERVTVVVQTEFGRRAYENVTLGTDHGRGSVMMLLGPTVAGGKVAGEWPGMRKDQLEEPGDLRVTTDYRQILSEALAWHSGSDSSLEVFPSFSARPSASFVL